MKDHDLSRRLALASHELRAQLPPATLSSAIHRQLHRGHWKPRGGPRPAWLGWAGLGTACTALAAALVVHLPGAPQPEPQTVLGSDGFVRLVNSDAWQRARADSGGTWIVTTELPHSRLAALGLPYDPSRAGERMPAQLLMHSSGEVLAVRVGR